MKRRAEPYATMLVRALRFAVGGAVLGLALAAPRAAQAQRSQRGQPRTPFAVSDFGKLRWLEGSWAATAPGEQPMYERFHFTSDSTVDISYYRDSSFAQPIANGRLYLSVGRVYHSFGPNRWGATHVDTDGAFFVPQVSAHNTVAWEYKSPNEWTMTTRNGLSGRERVTVWELKRVK